MDPKDFGKLDTPVEGATPVEGTTTATKNGAKAELKAKMASALQADIASDPTYAERRGRLVQSIEVVNTLGFGAGGLIQAAAGDKEKGIKRQLGNVSAIVGYVIRNVGKEPIPVKTEIFALNKETGKYVGEAKDVTLAPGDTMAVTRKQLAMLGMLPEFCMKVKNGSLVPGGAGLDKKGIDAALESFYFKPADSSVRVHDDGFKVDIHDAKTDGDKTTYTVKAEYVPTFGFLMNAPEGKTRASKASSADGGELVAALLRHMAAQG